MKRIQNTREEEVIMSYSSKGRNKIKWQIWEQSLLWMFSFSGEHLVVCSGFSSMEQPFTLSGKTAGNGRNWYQAVSGMTLDWEMTGNWGDILKFVLLTMKSQWWESWCLGAIFSRMTKKDTWKFWKDLPRIFITESASEVFVYSQVMSVPHRVCGSPIFPRGCMLLFM